MKAIISRTICKAFVAIATLLSMAACNNAGYDVIKQCIYVSEANANMLQKIMVDDKGGKATVSVRTNSVSQQDIIAQIGVDEVLLKDYNQKVGTNYELLPADCYKLGDHMVKIAAGSASAGAVAVTINPLPAEIINSGKKYAIPLSILNVEGGTPVLESVKGVIYALDQVIVTSAPKLNRSNMIHYNFKEAPKWDNWTIEMILNMDNLGNGSNGNFNNQSFFNSAANPDAEKKTPIFMRFGDAMIPGNKLQVKLCGNVAYESNLVFNINEWYHLAFVYDGSKFRVYIDGVLDKETDANYGTFWQAKDGFTSINGSSGYFKCNMKIREVRMWNVAISTLQIRENMFAVDPSSAGLEAYWKMNEGKGNTISDATGKGNDGVIDGTVTWLNNVRSDKKSDNR